MIVYLFEGRFHLGQQVTRASCATQIATLLPVRYQFLTTTGSNFDSASRATPDDSLVTYWLLSRHLFSSEPAGYTDCLTPEMWHRATSFCTKLSSGGNFFDSTSRPVPKSIL